jgi:DNA invertase Pin-like site-specific DNA recombinase
VGRPELAAALDDLDRGDELVIAEWDRATRSRWDGLQIIKSVIDAGAIIKVLDRNYIDLTTPMGRGFMAMMSAMAEDERLRIIKRTHEGRQIARANGVKMGRKPKLTPYQTKEARQRICQGREDPRRCESFQCQHQYDFEACRCSLNFAASTPRRT